MFDGDGGRDATDVVDARLIHAVEELPHIRAERLDVTALALCVNCFEGQARFSRAARPRYNRQFSERKINIDSFEIVLPRPADFDAISLRWRDKVVCCPNL